MQSKIKIAFFGTPQFAADVLSQLEELGILPDLIVTNPDEPVGRRLVITPPPVKVWAKDRNIKFIQPENLKKIPIELTNEFDLFVVVAYGKIIPESILNLAKRGTINVHPSLLPKYRGPSPIQAAILNGDKEIGVSIMLLDKEMDHGPIIAQETIDLSTWHPYIDELRSQIAQTAGSMLSRVIPDWIDGDIASKPQDHSLATFTKKITKEDGYVDPKTLLKAEELNFNEAQNVWRKVRALNPDPGVYTVINIHGKDTRIKITRAAIEDGQLIIEKVIPEGKKEMAWIDFKRGNLK